MSSMAGDQEPRAIAVRVTDEELVVKLADGEGSPFHSAGSRGCTEPHPPSEAASSFSVEARESTGRTSTRT